LILQGYDVQIKQNSKRVLVELKICSKEQERKLKSALNWSTGFRALEREGQLTFLPVVNLLFKHTKSRLLGWFFIFLKRCLKYVRAAYEAEGAESGTNDTCG